ncbi:hypothetical protein O1611_g9655 [Lasiodiplodia mahajangana]|uniref:Uncharacterized protein n=1 Tax=Lasiodiplodia mahajangana TaxID=1108764 RepID=A0ACC2J6T8_9PEZI|nr:hypothetical protein O1611_g9655 [Lasiodiplodia mahajangana]
MNVLSWLEGIEAQDSVNASAPEVLNTRKRKRRRLPTPSPSAMSSNSKKRRSDDQGPEYEEEEEEEEDVEEDIDQTPRGRAKAWSISDRTGSSLSRISRTSPTKRLAILEGADNPIIVAQINRSDPRMPEELKMMLNTLDNFQLRAGIVPFYLRSSIERRAKWDSNFYNFQPTTFQNEATENVMAHATALDPELSLDQVLEVFLAANECFNGRHPEATWNTLVHWPTFQLALGAIVEVPKAPPEEDGTQEQEHQVRVRAMPCTTARLKGNPRGKKMVDYCMFVEPQNEDLAKLIELWKHPQLDYNINHADHYPLRQKPVVLSAESKKPGEGFQEAQVQLSVWQGAQWALLECLIEIAKGDGKDTTQPLIPFLPALIIQGHEWSFAATTRSGKQTILWLKQDIGKTDSVLGVFQIVHALRYIAGWIRETYWPWYQQTILRLSKKSTSDDTGKGT